MKDRPTPDPELNSVLQELVTSVQAALGDAFVGAYLQGSFAVGDFDRHSDVDFVIAVSDELSDDHVIALQAMHEREHGIRLAGPSAAALVDPIPVGALRREIRETIRGWGEEILDQPERYRNRFYQSFIVLSYCRMLHDLVEGRPGSKRAGAAWAKAILDPTWSALIDRAWDGRPNPAVGIREPPDSADFERTLQFVRSIIRESERYAGDHPGG